MRNTIDPYRLSELLGAGKLPVIYSHSVAECGLACIAMIANYHGHDVDLLSLRKRFFISINGASFHTLGNIADKLNLQPQVFQLDVKGLDALQTPCILHWDNMHFVVLKKITARYAVVHDPARGIRKLDIDQVADSFSGHAMELTPTASGFTPLKEKAPRLRLRDFWQHTKGIKLFLVQLLLLSVVLQGFALLSPLYMQTVIDRVLVNNDQNLLFVVALGFSLILIIQTLITAFRSILTTVLGASFSLQLSNNLLRHLLRLPLEFFQVRHIGDLVSRFGSLESVKHFVMSNALAVLIDGIMVITSLILMMNYSLKLALLVFSLIFIDLVIRTILFSPILKLTNKVLICI